MTPMEMQSDPEKEWNYSRDKNDELIKVLTKQKRKSFLDYKQRKVLIIQTDLFKTVDKNEKRRIRFDRLVTFQRYIKGNVLVKIYRPLLIQYDDKP